MPFRTSQFDFASLGYALRHLDQPATFLEMFRILRPGGIVCILEISAPTSFVLRRALSVYIGRVVRVGPGHRIARVTSDLWKYF